METTFPMQQDVVNMGDVLGPFGIRHVNVTQDGLVKIAVMKQCQPHLNPNLMSNTR